MINEFWFMDGYNIYIWPSYILTFFILFFFSFSFYISIKESKKNVKEIRRIKQLIYMILIK